MRPLRVILLATISVVAGIIGTRIFLVNQERKNIMSGQQMLHELQEPLLLQTDDPDKPYYMLPSGTTLFFHHSMPEGFDTYMMYINFKGKLPLKKAEHENLIAPIWAHRLEKTDIQKFLNQYPLSKDDLVDILKARKITRDDLADIVRNWKD